MERMTVKQYAALRQVSPVAVTRAMNKGKSLVGVSTYGKIGRDWFLSVDKKKAEKKPKKYLVI